MRWRSSVTRLAFAFSLLIVSLLWIDWEGSDRVSELNRHMDNILDFQWRKVQTSQEALGYSTRNNRITMAVFLMTNAVDTKPLFLQRVENSDHITTLIKKLEAMVESDQESQLLEKLKAARIPYVESYRHALSLWQNEGKFDEGRNYLVNNALPRLQTYHAAWEKFVDFQGGEMNKKRAEATAAFSQSRRQFLLLLGVETAFATALALVVLFALVRHERENRDHADALRLARDTLERQVKERTKELANSASLLDAVLQATPDGVFAFDLNGHTIYGNENAAKLWGIPLQELLRGNYQDVAERVAAKVQEPDAFQKNICLPINRQGDESVNVVELKDGRVFERYGRPQVIDGARVGRVIIYRDITARTQAERGLQKSLADLRARTAFFEAMVNASLDGIMVVDPLGDRMVQNRRMTELWEIPDTIANASDRRVQLEYMAGMFKDGAQYRSEIVHFFSHPDEVSRAEILLKNGRVLDRYSAPVLSPSGDLYGRIWTFRDITDKKRMEQEVEKTQKQLLLASRQAGMAEVATGVLHNVGNVLNSINISTTLLAEHLQKSQVDNVRQLATLIGQHEADFGSFVISDPTGKQIPSYFGRLSERLQKERSTLVRETELIRHNFEHIRDIVAMQQTYAKCFGVVETVQLESLVEDAIRLNAGALTRHEVTLQREYAPNLPPVSLEKHKLLQILVNLIRNAKYACDESNRKDKLLVIQLTRVEDKVRIAVIDNGIGIPPENITRIFNHGFTTRKNGHGFGLHSAALAAKDLGGELTVHSDGTGKGATFAVTIPLLLS